MGWERNFPKTAAIVWNVLTLVRFVFGLHVSSICREEIQQVKLLRLFLKVPPNSQSQFVNMYQRRQFCRGWGK